MPEQHQSEKAIFLAAIEISSAVERAAFLDKACVGNQSLRSAVEALLRAYENSLLDARMPATQLEPERGEATPSSPNDQSGATFATGPSAGLPAPRPAGAPSLNLRIESALEQPGTMIGPYKLMEQIGEGGMGLVFVAEQQRPIRRKVALKVVKPGMDTRAVIARFEAERQALALMDHPNIAKVLDGGQTAGGRPYFVMELVKGVPITQFCDDNRLTTRQRLELFVSVCQAVQHAHQKGIIHRDIKPSNVMVMSHDGKPVPRVIDFGVTKAIGQQLTDKTVYTQMAQLIGTPLYMSPEQAGQSSLDVDTRTDIYSLGVLLYELLTGPSTRSRVSTSGSRTRDAKGGVFPIERENIYESRRTGLAARAPAVPDRWNWS
jgi:serine/threonine protein kinase